MGNQADVGPICSGDTFASVVRNSKIAVTGSIVLGDMVMRFLEIPANGAVMLGELSVDGKMVYNEENTISVAKHMSDDQIEAIIMKNLRDKEGLEKKRRNAAKEGSVLTYDKYANHVYDACYQERYSPIAPYLKHNQDVLLQNFIMNPSLIFWILLLMQTIDADQRKVN